MLKVRIEGNKVRIECQCPDEARTLRRAVTGHVVGRFWYSATHTLTEALSDAGKVYGFAPNTTPGRLLGYLSRSA